MRRWKDEMVTVFTTRKNCIHFLLLFLTFNSGRKYIALKDIGILLS